MDFAVIFEPARFLQVACLIFLSILFLQSSLHKIFNYVGNLDWLKNHFASSPLKGSVRIMLPAITLLEVCAGILSISGLTVLLFDGNPSLGLRGAQVATIAILALFFGQRIARDYKGSVNLVIYFLVCLASVYVLGT